MADTTPAEPRPSGKRPQQGKVARDINDAIRYTSWSVFRATRPLGEGDRASVAREVDDLV
ncbi:MAG TPA: hypothetical protein VFL59_08340 [Candidatus Nanopelagicales bacterium]|nr:hypothetical protein [Candidatus Nanopelagicales bacterium]